MADVAEAYHHAHAGDRQGVFRLSSEFDQVRERIEYLRDHPDLKLLEADVLTLAAQMSQQSHRLAEIYSDERVARAKDFLQQRQEEAEEQQRRIVEALGDLPRDRPLVEQGGARGGEVASQLAVARRAAAGSPAGPRLQARRRPRRTATACPSRDEPLAHGVEVRRPPTSCRWGRDRRRMTD